MKQEQSGVNGKPFKPQEGANGKAKATPNQSRSGSALQQLDAKGATPGEYLFQGHTVRTVTLRGIMWFVMTDICAALNYVTPAKMIAGLHPSEKGMTIIHTPGGPQNLTVISESGLYCLTIRSHKREALPFRLWVTNEVLPAIRRTGFYSRDGERPDAGDAIVIPTPDELTRYVVLAGRGIEPSIRRTDPMDTIAEYGVLDLDALCFALKSIDVWWRKSQIGLSLHPEATKGFAIAQLDESMRNGIRIVDQYFGRPDGA